jgi:D-ribose pyranose/furanose isomerase RbsD
MTDARTPDEIRKDIEHTREELADTAAALAEKADVKARAHEKVEETKAKVSHKVDDAKRNPRAPILVAAGVGGVVVAWLAFRRR